MQISYCESCGIKLPESDHSTNLKHPGLCEACAAEQAAAPTHPSTVLAQPTSRKSSATRLPAVKPPTPSTPSRTARGSPRAGIPITPSASAADDGRATMIVSVGPPREIPVPPLPAEPPRPVESVTTAQTTTMGFYFCEKCGKKVTEADLEAGRARDKQVRGVFCVNCAQGTLTVSYDAITQEELKKDDLKRPVVERRSTSRVPAAKPVSAPSRRLQPQPNPSKSNLYIGLSIAGVLLLVGAVFLLSGSHAATGPEEQAAAPHSKPPMPPEMPPSSAEKDEPPLPPVTPPPVGPVPETVAPPPENVAGTHVVATVPERQDTTPPTAPSPSEEELSRAGPGYRTDLVFWMRREAGKDQAVVDAAQGRNGLLTNGASWIDEEKGPVLSFDGNEGSAELPSAFLNDAPNWTWSAWIYPSNSGCLYTEGIPQVTLELSITGDNAVRLKTWHREREGNWFEANSTPGMVPFNHWSFLAVTLTDGGPSRGTCRFYVNGQELGSVPSQAESHPEARFAVVGDNSGAHNGGDQQHAYLQGRIRDLRIHRRALSPAEINILAHWNPMIPIIDTPPVTDTRITKVKEDEETETDVPQKPHRVDLLPLINPVADTVNGSWLWTDDGLRCYPKSASFIMVPYIPPAEYDLTLTFTEHSGEEAVSAILSMGDQGFMAALGAYSNSVFGFEMIQGKTCNGNISTRPGQLEMGKRYTMVIRVRKGSIELLLDDQVVSSCKVNNGDLSLTSWAKVPPGRERQLGLGSWRTCVTYHSLEVMELKGRGRITRQTALRTKSGPVQGKALPAAYLMRLCEVLNTEPLERARNLIGQVRGEEPMSGANQALDQDLEVVDLVEKLTDAANQALPALKDAPTFALRLADGRTVSLGASGGNKVLGMKDGKAEVEIATPNGNIVEKIDGLRLSLRGRGELVLLTKPDDPLGRFGKVAGQVIGFLEGASLPSVAAIEKSVGELGSAPGMATGVARLKSWLTLASRERAAKATFDRLRKPLNSVQQEQVRASLDSLRKEYADTLFVQSAQSEMAALECQWQEGLRAMYYAGDPKNFFRRLARVRYEEKLECDWGEGPFMPGFQSDFIGVRMEGLLRIEKAGIYEFELVADDELLAQIGSMSVGTKGVNVPALAKTYLSAGDQTLKIVYREVTGPAWFHLRWKPPGKPAFEPIPPSMFCYRADSALQSSQQDRPIAVP